MLSKVKAILANWHWGGGGGGQNAPFVISKLGTWNLDSIWQSLSVLTNEGFKRFA